MNNKSQPLYMKMKEYLLSLIDDNKHISNYKLPSENQLALRFDASRISAKRAINELQDEGVIYRIQGKGSFINNNINSHSNTLSSNTSLPNSKNLIAMIVPGIDSRFMINIIEGVKNHLNSYNFELVLMISDSSQDKEKELIKTSLNIDCKGLIIFPCDNQIYNPEILKLSINKFPTVLVDRKLEGVDISYVASDHFNSSFNATNYLLEKGHKKIGFISPVPKVASSVVDRIKGYEKALSLSTGFTDNLRLNLSHSMDNNINEIKNYLATHNDISAIICEGGMIGLNFIKVLLSLNLRCPEDIELIVYDNEFEKYIDFLPFKPIVIEQNPYHIGHNASKVLCNLINKYSTQSIFIKENIIYPIIDK